VATSQYACPDGRLPRAGLTPDRRHLVLLVDGRRLTLQRRPGSEDYGNSHYLARMDDLFLHLGIAGTLLPQHCRLLPGPESAPAPLGSGPATP
jgi:hypothetical protein